jgi:hypothetical protein
MTGNRNEMEKLLLAELREAAGRLGATQAMQKRIGRLLLHRGKASDGTLTLNEANLLYAEARKQYSRAFGRFSNFVVGR